MAATKIRWGDTLDEDDSLPPNTIVGPDKQGIKTITEYKKNERGEIVKSVTKIRVSRVEKKIYAVRDLRQRNDQQTYNQNLKFSRWNFQSYLKSVKLADQKCITSAGPSLSFHTGLNSVPSCQPS
jgi:hypothetical protein